MLGISDAELVRGMVDGAAMVVIAIWDAIAASPKLQAATVVFLALSFLSGGTVAGRHGSKAK